MKVLIIGSNGQLGWELQRTVPRDVHIEAKDYPEIDITDQNLLKRMMADFRPDWVVNAAAFTQVDGAEKEPDLAYAVNCTGVEYLAGQVMAADARLVHISTDFVFRGDRCRPYRPLDPTDPQSVYGRTKLAGEQVALRTAPERITILRTAWLYSSHGTNFVKTMLQLMENRDELRIVDDQVGTPTWAKGLAMTVWAVIEKKVTGICHWTDAGVASWYDFAVAIQEEALALKLISKKIPLHPIPAEAYPTPAKRPHYSVLDKTDLLLKTDLPVIHWRCQLRQMMRELSSQ